jgi:transposase-like protein
MPTRPYLSQLFSPETCQAYLHMLRWKDRPFQCPHCQSPKVGPWGTYHYRPGCQRYRCKGCRRTFNDLTKTLLSHSKLSVMLPIYQAARNGGLGLASWSRSNCLGVL